MKPQFCIKIKMSVWTPIVQSIKFGWNKSIIMCCEVVWPVSAHQLCVYTMSWLNLQVTVALLQHFYSFTCDIYWTFRYVLANFIYTNIKYFCLHSLEIVIFNFLGLSQMGQNQSFSVIDFIKTLKWFVFNIGSCQNLTRTSGDLVVLSSNPVIQLSSLH